MNREEILQIAKEAGVEQAGFFELERFANLVVAQYEQDALRYRWLRDMHDSGDPDWFVYAANPEIPLGVAIDAAMEQTK